MSARTEKRISGILRLSMDIGRLSCIPLKLFLRTRKLDARGKPYKSRLRGGAVLVSNHVSFFDPIIILCAFIYRRVFYFASEELMDKKRSLIPFLLRSIGCIRIDRQSLDLEAIRKGCEIIGDGGLLTVFAQGQIQRSGEIESFKSGAVLLALRTGAPIIPTYITKYDKKEKRRTMIIGDSFDCKALCQKKFPSVQDIDMLTAELLQRMTDLQNIARAYETGDKNDN